MSAQEEKRGKDDRGRVIVSTAEVQEEVSRYASK